jgi:hypothetical protein
VWQKQEAEVSKSKKKKVALKAALFAFVAGAHHVTEEVEKSFSLKPGQNSDEVTEARRSMLLADYERFLGAPESAAMLAEMLNEEGLFPLGDEWASDVFEALMEKLIAPNVVFSGDGDGTGLFRFKVGFKNELHAASEGSSVSRNAPQTNDHWLALLLNTAFYAGITAASRMAENSRAYFAVLQEIESEMEPWSRYPQVLRLFDSQLKREAKRKTGTYSEESYE